MMKLVWRFCFILFFILFIFALTPFLFAQVDEQNSLETTAIRSPQSPPVVEDTVFVVATATPRSQPAEDNDNASGGLTIDGNSKQITVSTDFALPLCLLIFALILMAFYLYIRSHPRNGKAERRGTQEGGDPKPTNPGEPSCKICGKHHDERLCPTRQPTPDPNNETEPVGPPNSEEDGPSPPVVNWPRDGHSQDDPHDQRSHDESVGPHISDSSSNPTEPGDPDPDPWEPHEITLPKTGPAVTYIISDGKENRYLNGSGGLLARDDLYTRQITLDHDRSISTPHAVIRFEKPGKVTIRDLRSTNGTFVNHKKLPIGQAIALEQDSQIRFGTNSEYRIDLQKRKLYNIHTGLPEIDLSQENLWVITNQRLSKMKPFNDKQLSNPHLLIRPNDPDRPLSFKLRDLGSLNGTYIKDRDVRQMRDGTFIAEKEVKIKIGRSGSCYTIKAQWTKMAFKSGDLIGERYEVEKQIEQTGMSELYLVRNNKSGYSESLVAKIPYTQRYGENAVLSAFRREIELMTNAKLRHKNLLSAKDSLQSANADQNYLIMPYIDGYNLGTLLERFPGQLRLADAKEIVDQLLFGLEQLHDNGWVHCDLKPDNILLSKKGDVFLIDLGAATEIGKPAAFHNRLYSAPETGSKKVVSKASDIYSVGKILFLLITGQKPKRLKQLSASQASRQGGFKQTNTIVTDLEYRSSHIQLSKLLERSDHGQNFVRIIEKSTAESQHERYQNVKELRQALQKAYENEESKAILKQEGPANLRKLVNN